MYLVLVVSFPSSTVEDTGNIIIEQPLDLECTTSSANIRNERSRLTGEIEVKWKMKENMIVLGKPLNLECTTSSTNNRNVSRRWTGGAQNRLLCFNGVTTNPQKYKETEESSYKYTLQIKETTEDDLDCPYSCRFGFQADEKTLYVTKDNFVYIPNKNETEMKYVSKEGNYTLHLAFNKVFPEPVCKIQLKNTLHNLNKIKETKGRIFYHVSYQLESRDPLHACGSDLEINCTFGSESYVFPHQNNLSCTNTLSSDETKSSESNIGSTVVLVVILAAILITAIAVVYSIYYFSNKRRSSVNDKEYIRAKTNVSSKCIVDANKQSAIPFV
ncbi:unnamed protein product [Mytilus edulis]|uniref:Ig-like domain-containing protein n=1 Tax=Mytilus edulis TaxID=6550 RepID=A0A8S3QKG5_MYTED|nr:unnamed protein product [Mytilus edulis]